jgi:hypothetical protein
MMKRCALRWWSVTKLLLVASSAFGPALAGASYPCPRGLYVLDSSAGTNINGVSMRDANLRTNTFVTGYALRVGWSGMEPARDQFDFTIIDWNVRRLAAAGKKLSLLFMNTDPPWLAEAPGTMTWFDASTGVNRLRAVPWDPFLLARFEVFLHALAEHTIDGVKFKDHPALAVVNAGLAGAKLAIRDPSPVLLRTMTNYSRANLTGAVLSNLRAAVTNFPAQFVQIGFWPVTDSQVTPSLWEELRQAILSEFNGTTLPRVGFWMENLSASRPALGQDPVTGHPITSFGAPLHLSQTNTWANFQALTSWLRPFNNFDSSVTNATPADGINYAFATYGSTYFELYVNDIDAPGYLNELESWQARLTAAAPRLQLISSNGAGVTLRWDRAARVTAVEAATNCAGSFAMVASLTNRLELTNAASGSGNKSLFFRVHQPE